MDDRVINMSCEIKTEDDWIETEPAGRSSPAIHTSRRSRQVKLYRDCRNGQIEQASGSDNFLLYLLDYRLSLLRVQAIYISTH